jgi:deoxyribose-phosphate aldolase
MLPTSMTEMMTPPTAPDIDIAGMIDHTLLRPDATLSEIERLCHEASRFGFASVCVNACHVALCRELLEGTGITVCATIGFPLGATSTVAKACEAEQSIRDGAGELEMVMNIGLFKSGELEYVERDIRAVVAIARPHGVVVKVILETGLLTDEEKVTACMIAKDAGANFVKTSTGFGNGGATVEDVNLMRKTVGPGMGVKASGGVRTRQDALSLIAAGANRIGASESVSIVGVPPGSKQ